MKALRFHEYGDVNVLRYEEAPTPRPGPGEVLVAVAATAFNPVDRWFRAGAMDEVLPVCLPYTLGLDVAGTVVDHGPGVEGPAVGAEVIGFLPMTGPGAGAEYVTAPAELLADAEFIVGTSAGAFVGALPSSGREVTDALTSLAALGQSIDPDTLAAGDEAFHGAMRQAGLDTDPDRALRVSPASVGPRSRSGGTGPNVDGSAQRRRLGRPRIGSRGCLRVSDRLGGVTPASRRDRPFGRCRCPSSGSTYSGPSR